MLDRLLEDAISMAANGVFKNDDTDPLKTITDRAEFGSRFTANQTISKKPDASEDGAIFGD